MTIYRIWTDGATENNGDKNKSGKIFGGLGGLIEVDGEVLDEYKDDFFSSNPEEVSNNRMELLAIIRGMELSEEELLDEEIEIYSDSAYCINAMNEYLENWKNNSWKNYQKKPVKNQDLWKLFLEKRKLFSKISFIKTKGHSGVKFNERADRLATEGLLDAIRKHKKKGETNS
jgi:ribonuclease HI